MRFLNVYSINKENLNENFSKKKQTIDQNFMQNK
jgi:hypothetical protein